MNDEAPSVQAATPAIRRPTSLRAGASLSGVATLDDPPAIAPAWAGRPFTAATAHLPFASGRAPRLIGLFTDLVDTATPVVTASDLKAVGQANVAKLMELPGAVALTYDLEERVPALCLLVSDEFAPGASSTEYPRRVAAVIDEGEEQRVLSANVQVVASLGTPVVSAAGLLG